MIPDAIDRFLSAARQHPDKPAISSSTTTVTYKTLETRARTLAAAILATRLHAPKILIALPQEPDAYAAMIGTALAGGVYAPVNLRSPPEKIRAICTTFQPDIIIGRETDIAPFHNAIHINPDIQTPPLPGPGTRHELAYVIHTSGSTGHPKGVEIPRTALDHYVNWLETGLAPQPQDRISQYANIAFDLSVMEIYGALCFGASLHPPEGLGDRMFPARMIARERISIWISVPSVISLMMQGNELTPANMASVRRFVFCGEPLLTHQCQALFTATPNVTIQNTYGPTEATVSMTSLLLTRQTLPGPAYRTIPIGTPIAGMGLTLQNGPSPDEGEIVLTGPQLARGYAGINHPQAFRTQETPAGSVRSYHTGDWARRIDGNLYFQDRIDFQIKHKGFRIELGEIMAALAQCGYPAACVFKHGPQLVALIEGRGDPAALRTALATRLDSHSIPDTIRLTPHLPRGETDKIDRRAAMASFTTASASTDHPVDQRRKIANTPDRVDVPVG